MSRLSRQFRVILMTSLMAVALLFAMATVIFYEKPPAGVISQSRIRLNEAKKASAPDFAPAEFAQASLLYDMVMKEWSRQNSRFFLVRGFDSLLFLATSVQKNADYATKAAIQRKANLHNFTREGLSRLTFKIDSLNRIIKKMPADEEINPRISECQISLLHATELLEKQQFLAMIPVLQEIEFKLGKAETILFDRLNRYFENYDYWQHIVVETIEMSRKNRARAIIVDKFSRHCTLYQNGNPLHRFPVELGKNWIGDKEYQGDLKTPEGKYVVLKKLGPGKTIFHKALLLNYPNQEDQQRFDSKKKNGILPKSKRIGGAIEIHGHGGKGGNWTEGCIALANIDMDVLFRLVDENTLVTIIGSSKPLHQIIIE